jgi:hypothetical protein
MRCLGLGVIQRHEVPKDLVFRTRILSPSENEILRRRVAPAQDDNIEGICSPHVILRGGAPKNLVFHSRVLSPLENEILNLERSDRPALRMTKGDAPAQDDC